MSVWILPDPLFEDTSACALPEATLKTCLTRAEVTFTGPYLVPADELHALVAALDLADIHTASPDELPLLAPDGKYYVCHDGPSSLVIAQRGMA